MISFLPMHTACFYSCCLVVEPRTYESFDCQGLSPVETLTSYHTTIKRRILPIFLDTPRNIKMSSSTMTTLLSGAKYFLLKILRLLFSRQSHHEFNRDGTWLNMIDFCMSFLSKLPRLPQVICRIAKNLLLALRRPKSIIFTALYLRIYRLIWPKPKTTFYSLPREVCYFRDYPLPSW